MKTKTPISNRIIDVLHDMRHRLGCESDKQYFYKTSRKTYSKIYNTLNTRLCNRIFTNLDDKLWDELLKK